jgi:hypothetical protein
MRARKYIGVPTVLFAWAIFFLPYMNEAISQTTVGCNYYASPTGTGNGLSQSSPFKVGNFWSVAKPGSVLCLLDGTYTGSSSTITPPQNLKGMSGSPITVRALSDGKVLINGQGTQPPIMLYFNDWFVIEGINACCSNQSVIHLGSSHNNIIRRVAAWDAADGNTSVFGVHSSTRNLLEDVAGWGIARKIFQFSQGGNFTTVRRAWGRWEGSTVVGPKTTYELVYNNYDVIAENVIGTWSGEKIPYSYTLLDYYGKPWTGSGAGTYTNYSVDQPHAIFDVVGNFTDGYSRNARAQLLGSIAYLNPTDKSQPDQLVFGTQLDYAQIANTVAYIPAGLFSTKKGFGLYGINGTTATNLSARNLTAIGGTTSDISSVWQPSNILQGASASSVFTTGDNVFSGTRGAKICYRYQNGTLTTQPLWPWPMNQRIKEALVMSGRSTVDVTATIESIFGLIPAACKSTGGTSSPTIPSTPINLHVQR